jgi:hypothetical protein
MAYVTSTGAPSLGDSGALAAVVREIDRHVAGAGWDRPPRIYALVATAELLAAEPALASTLGRDIDADSGARASLTPVEQDDLPYEGSIGDALAQIEWPPTVAGCALVLETVTEGGAEGRLTVAVLRSGARAAVLRWRAYDSDASVLVGPDLAPGLAEALAITLEP